MKNLILLLILISFIPVFGQNQKIETTKLDSIVVNAERFLGYDQFDYYYLIKNNVLSKNKNQEILEYKNPSLGEITKVDLQNSLKIVLFYENFNTIIILDNQLNETQKINLSENSTPISASATGIASQNQLWIYNILNQQIGLYDYLKKDYKTVSTSFPENIKYYHSDFNTFFWIDKKNNWYSCDIYGKTNFRGKIPDFDSIELINDHQFIFCKDSSLFFVDFEKNQKIEIKILEKSLNKFYYKDQILSIFTSKGITNYKIILP